MIVNEQGHLMRFGPRVLLLADKVPATIRQRIRERPDVFRTLASLDDSLLDEVVEQVRERSSNSN